MKDNIADNLEIIQIDIDKIKPFEKNAKLHPDWQIEQIKKSIEQFGMNDAIAVWEKDNTIVEGHGRWLACKELGYTTIPCIRLDHLTDEERKAYTLAHNKLTMNTDFDKDLLSESLEDIFNIDMSLFGFMDKENESEEYTTKTDIPQYEVKGEKPTLDELVDTEKSKWLIDEIETADIPKEVKEFLKISAYRHNVFNYKKIAEYYAQADKEVQELFERSALVIIDYDEAIKNGYAKLKDDIFEMRLEDDTE